MMLLQGASHGDYFTSHTAQATPSFRQWNPSFGMRGRGGFHFIIMVGEEDLEAEAFLHKLDGEGSLNHRDPTHNLMLHNPSRSRGMSEPMLTTNVGNVEKWDMLRGPVPC